MGTELDELAEWLSAALDPTKRMPGARPTWLGGSIVEMRIDDTATLPTVRIEQENGARSAVLVMHIVKSPAQQQVLEEKLAAYKSSPKYQEDMSRLADIILRRGGIDHAEHDGPFESCQESLCKNARAAANRLKGGIYIPDEDGAAIN